MAEKEGLKDAKKIKKGKKLNSGIGSLYSKLPSSLLRCAKGLMGL